MALAFDVENKTTESAARAVLSWLFAVAVELGVWAATIWRRASHRPTASRSTSPAGAEPFGPYILGEKIGEGGMGVVYKAHQVGHDRPAAIKLLPFDRAEGRNVERFEREFQLTRKLSHPNTISVYDFGRTPEGSLYYAMEYLEGLDLQKLVDRTGPQPPARVAHLLAQICGALVEAHGAGLLHRDIKPANVFLCEQGAMRDQVKVLDFGLIKEFGVRAGDAAQTDVDSVVGTPTYLSPEAITAPDQMDGRSDLYAVGALGYFLLTGAPPFSGKTALEVCARHLHCEPVPPSARTAVPAELERLIMSCLAKSPAARPHDAASLRAALQPLAAEWTTDGAAPLAAPLFPAWGSAEDGAHAANLVSEGNAFAALSTAASGGDVELASVREAA